MTDKKNYHKAWGMALAIAFAVHVLVSLAITIFPKSHLIGHSLPARFYSYFVRLGPFFTDKSIITFTHLTAEVHRDNSWHSVDLTKAEMDAYNKNIFAVRHLSIRDFLHRNAREFSIKKDKRSEAFQKLNHFVLAEMNKAQDADSARLIYKTFWYNPQSDSMRVETTFRFQYPLRVE